MSEPNGKKEFSDKLLAQDPPSADQQQRHKEALLKIATKEDERRFFALLARHAHPEPAGLLDSSQGIQQWLKLGIWRPRSHR